MSTAETPIPDALARLIAEGRATPASRIGDVADFEPVPTGLSAIEILDGDRGND